MREESGIHPVGEEVFEFPTYDGKVVLVPTSDVMTPFGGLIPWAAYQKKTGIIEALELSCPIQRSSPNATPVRDILISFILTTLCDGHRFSHVERLREDPAITEVFGLKKGVAGCDAILRFFHRVSELDGRQWVADASRPIWNALPNRFILDWDSTVVTRYGHQEDAQVGYNPHKRGRPSHHPLLAVVADTRLCAYYRWRPGKSGTAREWCEAMQECQSWLGDKRPWLNRGDIGFSGDEILSWHEKQDGAGPRPHYLFKLKISKNVRRAIAKIPENAWQGIPTYGVLQVAETTLQLDGWQRPRRVILGRRLNGFVPAAEAGSFWNETKHEFEAYVTDLPPTEANAWQIVDLYRRRADCENVFDELKKQWGFAGFCSRKKAPTALAARLQLLAYNLWNLFLRLMNPHRHIEAFQGRRWFLLIAARIVVSGRQKELRVSVQGEWWQDLTNGYKRVCDWINLTASQLDLPLTFPTSAPPLLPSIPP